MFININDLKENKLLKFSLTNDKNYFKDIFSDLEGFKLNSLKADLKVEKKNNIINIKGIIKGVFKLTCVRCLNDFIFNKNIDFDVFFYVKKPDIKEELELGVDDLDASFVQDDKIDLKELIREQVILNIPEYPVCAASCSGGRINYGNEKILKKNPFSKLKDLKINK